MKTYTIIAGVNGVGKSSLTGILRAEKTDLGRIIDVDRIIAENNGDMMTGGKKSVRLIDDCLNKEICFTQETTLSGHLTLSTVKKAREKGYYIRLYYIGLDTLEESLVRIENRVRKGGHAVPEEDVARRFGKRFIDLAAVLPYCDEAVLYDNENGFIKVAEYKNGTILCVGERHPAWLNELLDESEGRS